MSETTDTLTYAGRLAYDLKSHRYILGSDRSVITFSKKLQKYHEVGETYPVTITLNDKDQRLFSTKRFDQAIDATWVTPTEMAKWVEEDNQAKIVERALREAKSLEAEARKLAREIKAKYRRASYENKRAIVRAFIEELTDG